jgi:hypothetical protein
VYLSLWTSNNLWKGITKRNSTPRWTELDLRNCLKKLKLDFTRKLENLDLRQTPFFPFFFLSFVGCVLMILTRHLGHSLGVWDWELNWWSYLQVEVEEKQLGEVWRNKQTNKQINKQKGF